ncbi:MAG: molybdopterin-binding protein [Planctomycetota bacterium]
MNIEVRIQDGPLAGGAPGAWTAGGGAAGAELCFEGVVRAEEAGQRIAALDYEVYEPMVTRELHRLAREVGEAHGVLGMRVAHSRGRVPVGQCAFRLHVTAMHRAEALRAVEVFIDRLKQDVPIWKKPVPAGAVGVPAQPVLPDSATGPRFSAPDEALRALCARLRPVESESVSLGQAVGRILASPVRADRDSPPCDVSAMDGYAVRLVDLEQPALTVAGEAAMGQAPRPLPAGQTLRVFTGAPLPPETEAVIPREQVAEEGERIALHALARSTAAGLYVRRRGENLRAGELALTAGVAITPAIVATLASFGVTQVRVVRKVRVAIINTGSEVVAPEDHPQPWQIRDSNGPGLAALLSGRGWIDAHPPARVGDDVERTRGLLAEALANSDAVLVTGAVSAGQYDFVPDVIKALGGETIFHRLPVRPGRPLLGAVGPQGQAILGLPGNPVSTLVAARRFAWVVLRHLAGMAEPLGSVPVVELGRPDDQVLPLWCFRPVRFVGAGRVELVPTRGSGDVVALGRGDGFIEVPPHLTGAGPWPFYAWES